MVERILQLIEREIRGIHEAAYLLGFFALLSQVLALVRDRLLASLFGAGETLDIYYAAFRIPDLIFVGVASFVSAFVLIPFFANYAASSKEEAKAFLDTIFTIFFVAISAISAACAIFAPQLLSLFFPTLSASSLAEEFVLISRILLLQPVLLGLSGLLSTVTQAHRKFILYAISPILYNVGILAGIIFFYPSMGLSGIALGVVSGALLHLGIQLPSIVSSGFLPRLRLALPLTEAMKVFALSLPRTAGLFAGQLSFFVLVALAARQAAGAVSVLNLSFNLQAVPLSIIGVSYSVAAFPTLARLYVSGERSAFFGHLVTAARHIIFWSLPIMALFIVLRAQVVRVIFGTGAFDWNDTRLTAAALSLFSLSLLAQGVVLLFARGYFAAGNTVKPLVVNVASSFLTIGGALALTTLFETSGWFRLFIESVLRVEGIEGTAVLMLPLAFSLASLGNAFVLYLFFRSDFKEFPSALSGVFFQSASAALAAGFVSYQALAILAELFDTDTYLGIFAQGLGAGLAGIASALLLLFLLQSRELAEISSSIRRTFWKTPLVLPEKEF